MKNTQFKITLSVLMLLIGIGSTNSFAQYCTNGGPTSTFDSELGAINLVGATTSISIAQTCPGITGVDDLTASQSADLIAGNSYSLSVEFSDCGGGSFSGVGEAWIDWNMDDAFSTGESVGTWSGSPTTTSNFNFSVPTFVCPGTTRLRVMQVESGSLPLNPCASFSYGTVMDFSILLSGGSCTPTGCTDPTALNYDSNAVIDDGGCQYLSNSDCIGAIPLCLDLYDEDTSYAGIGNVTNEFSTNNTCFGTSFVTGDVEVNSVWYTFTTPNAGDLAFTLTPKVFADDYDWVVFDITPPASCATIFNDGAICCNWSGDDGPTGPNGQGNSCATYTDAFNSKIPVDSNHTYVICVTNYSNSVNGYTIDFTESTANVYADYINVSDAVVCANDSVDLDVSYDGAIFGGGLQYYWSPGELFVDSTLQKPQTYIVDEDTTLVYVFVENGPCTFYDSLYIYRSSTEANFGWEFEDNGFPNDVFFSDSSNDATSLTWLFGDSGSVAEITASGVDLQHEYQEPGYYDVTQIAVDEIIGCTDTITIQVPMPLLLPNIITPNGDGENDLFVVKGLRRYSILSVYNQWGKRVLKVDDEYDGTWDGGNLPDGNYYYVITEPGSRGEAYKGWLRISR